jgi:hypothetical protein
MGNVGVAGLIFLFVAMLSAVSLYRTLKFGLFMHFVPYLLSIIGALLLVLAQAPDIANPVATSLLVTAVTAIIHGAVFYDMRKEFWRR